MTVLPELRSELLRVACAQAAATAPSARRRARRWPRRGTPLLAALAALVVAGGALAAVSGLLDEGEPVPASRQYAGLGPLVPGSNVVLPLRVPDPAGGPAWAIGVFDLPSDGGPDEPVRCVRVGRVQAGRLGVIGRDGLFGDDGRFHPQPALSSRTGHCAGLRRHGQLLLSAGGGPTPASGYSGAVTTPIGGCLFFRPKRATSSPQTRRRLRGTPLCAAADGRIVKYGFAGRLAVRVTARNDRVSLSMRPGPDGSYLFVARVADVGRTPLRITVAYEDGTVCESPAHHPRPDGKPSGGPCVPPPGF